MKRLTNLGMPLTKEEMKNVNGGTVYSCTFTFLNGDPWTGHSIDTDGTSAQCSADWVCTGDPNCTGVDCAGSGPC